MGNYINREYLCQYGALQVALAASVVESGRVNVFGVGNEMRGVSCVLGAASCPWRGQQDTLRPLCQGRVSRKAPLPATAGLHCVSLPWTVPITSPSGASRPPALAQVPSSASHCSCCPARPLLPLSWLPSGDFGNTPGSATVPEDTRLSASFLL